MCKFRGPFVPSLPQRGSLKWVHGTMSEPPWKSHEIALDWKWIDKVIQWELNPENMQPYKKKKQIYKMTSKYKYININKYQHIPSAHESFFDRVVCKVRSMEDT